MIKTQIELDRWIQDMLMRFDHHGEPSFAYNAERLPFIDFCIVQVDRLFKKYNFKPRSL